MPQNNLLTKPKYTSQEKMSNTDSVLKYKYMSQEHKFQEDKLNVIKLTITRLLMVAGMWTLFFMVYDLKVSEELTFKPLILSLLAIYVLGEIVLMFWELRLINKSLMETLDSKLNRRL